MFIVRLIRFFCGYVSFKATGAFVERFFNLVAHARINMWDMSKTDGEMTAYTAAKEYKKLRQYAKRTHVKLRVTSRHGAPFYLQRYRKRIGIAIGIAVFLIFIAVMSQFIWSVNINGNKAVPTHKIEMALKEQGVHIGVYKKSIDVSMSEQKIMLKVKELSWIAINISGTTANVEVREQTEAPKMVPVDEPCNVVAAKAGQIIKLEVYEGQELVKKGEAVKKGDIIVSGIMEDKAGNNTLTHASALAVAQVQDVENFNVPKTRDKLTPTGRVGIRKYVGVFGLKIPVWGYGIINYDYTLKVEENPANLFGAKIPLTFKTERYSEVKVEQEKLTAKDLQKCIAELIKEYEKTKLKGAKMISHDIKMKEDADKYKVTVYVVYEENIGVEQQILTEKTG